MTIALKHTDLLQPINEAQQQDESRYRQSDSQTLIQLPAWIGRGEDCTIHLRGGLDLTIRKAELYDSIQVENPHDKTIPLISKFHLSGNSRVLTPGVPEIKAEYEEISGCNYLYYLPDLVEFEEWRSRELIHVIVLLVDLDCLRSFGSSFDTLPKSLQLLIEGNSTKRFHQPLGRSTIAMQQILQQVMHCPYQGMMRKMYLECKALELLTLQFTCWSEGQLKMQLPSLKVKDIERLQHAREILIQNLENPPSLLVLAQQVGISDRKLKQGFRQLFGNTVFGYLHDYRLEQARQLLEADHMTVAEISYAIGFASRGYFAAAFRRKFGINPSDFQANCRHQRVFST